MNTNIVTTYINLLMAESEMTKTDVAVELSIIFTRPSYDIQRMNQWLKGRQSLPRDVYEHMMQEVMPSLSKLSDDERTAALSFPVRV